MQGWKKNTILSKYAKRKNKNSFGIRDKNCIIYHEPMGNFQFLVFLNHPNVLVTHHLPLKV